MVRWNNLKLNVENMKQMTENKKIEDKKAYKHIRRGYHNKLEFTKKNYLNIKIDEFNGNGKSYLGYCMT